MSILAGKLHSKAVIERFLSDMGMRMLVKKIGKGKNVQALRAVGFYDVAHHLALKIVREVGRGSFNV